MNKTVGILIALIVVGGASYMLMQPKPLPNTPSDSVMINDTPAPTDASEMVAKDDVIVVEGSIFKFVPNTITVKKGAPVTIIFKNIEGIHDFVVDELNIKTKILKAGIEESVTFTASTAGSYEFYCSVGNHRAMGMKGTLVVEE